MSMNKKRKKHGGSCRDNSILQLVGLILLSFGIITICAFLLPVKAWIFVLGCLLLLCGIVLILS